MEYSSHTYSGCVDKLDHCSRQSESTASIWRAAAERKIAPIFVGFNIFRTAMRLAFLQISSQMAVDFCCVEQSIREVRTGNPVSLIAVHIRSMNRHIRILFQVSCASPHFNSTTRAGLSEIFFSE